jgi:hypothetical protein
MQVGIQSDVSYLNRLGPEGIWIKHRGGHISGGVYLHLVLARVRGIHVGVCVKRRSYLLVLIPDAGHNCRSLKCSDKTS